MTPSKPALHLLIHTALLSGDTGPFRHAWTRTPQDGTFENIVERAWAVEEAGFDGVLDGLALDDELLPEHLPAVEEMSGSNSLDDFLREVVPRPEGSP